MRITVRGWGRDLGETEIMNARLVDALIPAGSYSRGQLYKSVGATKSRISTGTELRLGGKYLLHVELDHKEIAELFFETHTGAMVRMIKSFMEDEEMEERGRFDTLMSEYQERRSQRVAAKGCSEPTIQSGLP